MNKFIAGLFATVLVAGAAVADIGAPMPTAKDLDKVVDQVNYVETAKSGIVLSGYVDVGYIYNFIGTGSQVTNRNHQDGTHQGEFNLNAVKLVLEKPLTDANELQAGFRVDMLVGEDATDLGGTSLGDSGNTAQDFLVEQAYVQLRLPYGNGIDIKAGRFVTWLGYEVIERPSNLNITYGNLFVNMIPLHHIGVSAEYSFNDQVDTGLAIVNGYNGDDNFGSTETDGESEGDGYGIMAKLNIKNPGGNANIQQSVYYSWDSSYQVVNNTAHGGSYENGNVFIYDVWGNWAPEFANDKLLFALNGDFGFADTFTGSDSHPNLDDGTNTWWGVAAYAKYQFTDIFSLAGRGDYIHTDGASELGGAKKFGNDSSIYGNGEDIWSLTLTAGFDLLENFMVRVEYRYDFGAGTTDAGSTPGNDDIDGHARDLSDAAHTISVQAVYTF